MSEPYGVLTDDDGKPELPSNMVDMLSRLSSGYRAVYTTDNPFLLRRLPSNPVLILGDRITRQPHPNVTATIKELASKEVPPQKAAEFSRNTRKMGRQISNFMLREIAPYALALEQAMETVTDDLTKITGKATSISAARVQHCYNAALELRMIDFIARTLQLDEYQRAKLSQVYDSYFAPADPSQKVVDAVVTAAKRNERIMRNILEKLDRPAKTSRKQTAKPVKRDGLMSSFPDEE